MRRSDVQEDCWFISVSGGSLHSPVWVAIFQVALIPPATRHASPIGIFNYSRAYLSVREDGTISIDDTPALAQFAPCPFFYHRFHWIGILI